MSNAPVRLETLLAEASWVKRLAARLVADRDVAEDVVQETWISAWRRPPRGRAGRPWLATVVRNHVRSGARERDRRGARERVGAQGESWPPATAPDPEATLGERELEEALARAIEALDEPYGETVRLRYFEGLTAAEIGARSGVPAGTVRWRLQEALERIRCAVASEPHPARRRWGLLLGPAAPIATTGPAVVASASGPGLVAAALQALVVPLAIGWMAAVEPWRPPSPPREAPLARAEPHVPPSAPPSPAAPKAPHRGGAPAPRPGRPPAPPSPAAAPAPAPSPTTVFQFDDDVVDGDLHDPGAELVRAPTPLSHPSLIELRADFVPELLKALEDL